MFNKTDNEALSTIMISKLSVDWCNSVNENNMCMHACLLDKAAYTINIRRGHSIFAVNNMFITIGSTGCEGRLTHDGGLCVQVNLLQIINTWS